MPYNAGFLSGWVVERYQIDLVAAAQAAREEMDAEMERLCAAEVPGDTHRNLDVETDYSGQTFKHILAPIWLLTYNYGARNFQVVINGYTGAIAGKYPKSWIKITLAIFALAGVIGARSSCWPTANGGFPSRPNRARALANWFQLLNLAP